MLWTLVVCASWALAWWAGHHLDGRSPLVVLSGVDGTHYAHIATNGYSSEGVESRRFAFFPLFPALAHVLGQGGSAVVPAGILLSQICLLVTSLVS